MAGRRPTISELMPDYRAARIHDQDRRDNTLMADEKALRSFISSVGDIPPGEVTVREIRTWRDSMSHLSPSTINVRTALVKSFYKYLRAYDIVPRDCDPLAQAHRKSDPIKPRQRVEMTQFNALLDAATHPRDRALIAVGLFLFLRANEASGIRIRDLRLNVPDPTVEVWIEKNQTYDTMGLSPQLVEELRDWLRYYSSQTGLDINNLRDYGDWYLIPSKSDNPFVMVDGRPRPVGAPVLRPTRRMTTPWHNVSRCLQAIGFPTEGEGMHTLRRSGARAMFEVMCEDKNAAAALRRVSSMLHHADTKMTERYLGIEEDRRLRNVYLQQNVQYPVMNLQKNVATLLRPVAEA